MTSISLHPDLVDLHGFEPITHEATTETDVELGDQIEKLAVDIEGSIDEWQEYINDEMPEFEDRNDMGTPTTVEELIKEHARD